jgi:Adaptive response protein AidB N-terminal domain
MEATMPPTHEVLNQPPPLTGYDVSDDAAMLDAVRREGAGWAEAEVREIGRRAGTAQAQDWGRLANENPPVLRTHDRFGHRVDEVAAVADAFAVSRLGGDWGGAFGTLPTGVDTGTIIKRITPEAIVGT